jgi:very-short-patch-repair endonuclease
VRNSGRTIDAALANLAAKHCGLIRAADLTSAGIDRDVVTDRARLGVITSLQPHVWLFGQATPTFSQQCQAAVWTSDGTLGGPSALVWHSVLREPHRGMHPTVVLERNNRPTIRDAKTLRSTKLLAGDRCTENGLSVTSIPRTLLDSATELSIDVLERALDDALLAGKTTITRVKGRLDQAPHHRGVRDLRALINDRLPKNGELKGRITRSRAEQRIKRVILSLDVPAPQFNFRIPISGGSVELDVAWPEFRVGLNVDGFQWHGGRRDWKRDLQRDHQITVAGWNVKRIIPEITDGELFALIATLLGSLMG